MGLGFALLGVAFVAYGFQRLRDVDAALERGEYERPNAGVLMSLTIAGIVLGLSLAVIVALPG